MMKPKSILILTSKSIKRLRLDNKIMKTILIKSSRGEIERLVIQVDMKEIIVVVEGAESEVP